MSTAWTTSSYDEKLSYPNGSEQDTTCLGDWGVGLFAVSDVWETHTSNGNGNFRLADGGTVVFQNHFATSIIDPYSQTTTIARDSSGYVTRVTEPGGRYLQFNYSAVNGVAELTGVDAYDGRGNRIDWVAYHYTLISAGGHYGLNLNCLTSVDYSDGTHAYYSYQADNVLEHLYPCPCSVALFPVLKTCKDVRYKGPMRNISTNIRPDLMAPS